MTQDIPPSGGDILNGWKEIAAFLGKSVRSAQRWERELRLPVHRIRTPDGQIVYGRRSEIEAWRASLDHRPGVFAEAQDELHPIDDAPSEAGPSAPGLDRSRFVWIGASALALGAIGVSVMLSRDRAPEQSSGSDRHALVLSGSNLEARTPEGALLWSVPFESEVRYPVGELVRPLSKSSVSIARLDVDGDGSEEDIVPIGFGGTPTTRNEYEALVAVSGSGHVIWRVAGALSLSCGGREYRGPWRISAVLASRSPRPRVWVAYIDQTWWPSFVAEILPSGRQEIRYVQAGWIMSLAEWTTPSGRWGVAGGVMNEQERPALALFNLDQATAPVPASNARFRCDASGPSVPPRAILLPNMDIIPASGHAFAMVQGVRASRTSLLVEVDNARVTAEVLEDGTVRELVANSDYWLRHSQLEVERKIAHSASMCPERDRAKEVRYWTPAAGWTAEPVVVTTR